VVRGSSFSQLDAPERQAIVDRAGELASDGRPTVNAVAKVIANETGRAVETIRLILKNHDDARPKAGIFNGPNLDVEPNDGRLKVWEAYVDGASVEALARRFERSVAWIYRTVTTMRAKELQARKIAFVPSEEFEAPRADRTILNDPHLARTGGGDPPPRVPSDLAPYLQQLFHMPLLSREREAALFRKFNYLKFKADAAAKRLDPDTVKPVELDRIEQLLAEAEAVKNEITQANLRLVVSIAKRHVRGTLEFFELISDGNISLMKAVEKFDYSRGFKFSTYASWAIMKNFARSVPERVYHYDRYQTGRDELLAAVPVPGVEEHEDDALPAMRTSLERMLGTLDDRERHILRSHFGLDTQGRTMTLEEIGREFGVSKERIRQIESRAISKLREEFDEQFDALLTS
jgi:RNA polymerase sigma factor (sigma-70 family)